MFAISDLPSQVVMVAFAMMMVAFSAEAGEHKGVGFCLPVGLADKRIGDDALIGDPQKIAGPNPFLLC